MKVSINKSLKVILYQLALLIPLMMFSQVSSIVGLYPISGSININTDVQLRITFSSPPVLGNSGKIKVFEEGTEVLVDELDLSIAPGPRNTRTPAPYDTLTYPGIPDKTYTVYDPDTDTSHVYQLKYVGGTSAKDALHFYPVLFAENTVTITLHTDKLDYGKSYYVHIDASVFPLLDGSFTGITDKSWRFSTKGSAPASDTKVLTVACDGSGDFNTLQGAFDFIPLNNTDSKTILVKNGIYEEIVYLNSRHNLTVLGEDREKTRIRYATNGVFNLRRYEFGVQSCNNINLVNFTTESMGVAPAQAEGLMVKGDKIQVHNVTVLGSGDAVQARGRIFMSESSIRGFGDNVLGSGIFFNDCDFISTYGPHLWARNAQDKPGYVLLNCRLWGEAGVHDAPYNTLKITYARAPIIESSYSYPYTEAVLLNCAVADLRPVGFGPTTEACEDAHCWEYNTVNMSDGSPADYSQRVAYAKQLTMENDSAMIINYSDPTYVLDGWTPEYFPKILSKSDTLSVKTGESIELNVEVAAAPIPVYQWYKEGALLDGGANGSIRIDSVTTNAQGNYSVKIVNYLGADSSHVVRLIVTAPME